MNYKPGVWYDELYRIFSDSTLLTVAQTIQLGQCLRAIQCGENAEYHLNELYYSIRDNESLAKTLDEYIHAYIKKYREENEEHEEDHETFDNYQFLGSYSTT